MKPIGLLRGMRLCSRYARMDAPGRERLRVERLRAMVDYARANSPYYAALYRDVPEAFQLSDLPPVNKAALMARWDDWVTDRSVKRRDVEAFMEDLDNVGRRFRGKYLVFTTSGSTGTPLITLCDKTTENVMGAINTCRAFARREDLLAFMRRGGRTIGVFATGGFYLSNGSVRARLLRMPWKKRQIAVTSALLPVEQIVRQLNDFQPAMLGGYPCNLELLIEEQMSGRLHIAPVLIMTGGEHLSNELRDRLSAAFGCYVQTSYSCTEGSIACQCREGHFHINDDWLIVEPVDRHNRPVPDGVLSDKLLLTNLYNFTQPFIRYEVTDRVIRHTAPCPCGNPSPYLTLEGRWDDVIVLQKDGGGQLSVPPLSLYAALKETPGLSRFQLLAYPENRLALRLIPAEGYAREAVFEGAQAALTKLLVDQGVTAVSLTLADEPPSQHPVSGKFQHVIRVDGDG